jgi:hypothetical protein
MNRVPLSGDDVKRLLTNVTPAIRQFSIEQHGDAYFLERYVRTCVCNAKEPLSAAHLWELVWAGRLPASKLLPYYRVQRRTRPNKR